MFGQKNPPNHAWRSRLARFGNDRDGKRGLPIIVYGLLTNTQIGRLREHPGLGWISALRGPAIRALVESGSLQLSLFDEQNLAEIALRAGRVLNRFKVGRHFSLAIAEGGFGWSRCEESIRREAELDGVYVVRTSEPKSRCSAEDTVRCYKSLAQVERAFRSLKLKGIDLRIRPIGESGFCTGQESLPAYHRRLAGAKLPHDFLPCADTMSLVVDEFAHPNDPCAG